MSYPGKPNKYDFGTEFNWAVWTPGTKIDLVNVPWNNDYRDIVRFDSKEALNTYIDGLSSSGIFLENASYHKPNTPVLIPTPFNVASRYNYLRARNPLQPVGDDIITDYYYFITGVRYLNPGTTEISVQLDVWQTFGYDATFGNSYVERGHIGIANSKAFDSYGRDYLTVPEGIDIGGDYVMVTKRNRDVMSSIDLEEGDDDIFRYDVLVASSVDLLADPGTVQSPNLKSAKGGEAFGLDSGASYYVWQGNRSFTLWLQDMQDYPWVTQGIISATLIPSVKRYIPEFEYWKGTTARPTEVAATEYANAIRGIQYEMYRNWRNSDDILNYIPQRYRHLRKLWTSPYMGVEITTFSGSPLAIKPECWADPHGTIYERANLAPPNQRIAFHPYKYNAIPGSPTDPLRPWLPIDTSPGGDDNGDYLDYAAYMSNFPTVAIVNSGAIGYLASNAHQIAYQRRAADWSQQRALRASQASYDNTNTGIAANTLSNLISQSQMYSLNSQANQALMGQTALGLIGGAASGAASGGLTAGLPGAALGAGGGLVGGVTGAIGASINQSQMNAAVGINASSSEQQTRNQNRAAAEVRDTNKSLADWSARGDYAGAIAAINAKVQDAELIQPSVSGQMGGEALNFVNNHAFLSMRVKMIDQSAIRRIGEFWLRYGYAVHAFMKPPASLMVMSKFTYWKLSETYITGAPMPETFKQTIRGIFEKGVTVWKNPSDIGQIDIADNQPLSGVSY